MLYIENPEDSNKKKKKKTVRTNKFLKLKDTYWIHKSQVHFYPVINCQRRKQAHLQWHQKGYLGINLTKKVKDLYTNNYIEKIEKTQLNGKTFHAHGLEEYC